MGKFLWLLCLVVGAVVAAPLRDSAPSTTTATTPFAGMQPLTAEAEPFYADEEANWEPYTETQQEEQQQEHEFDEEYQRYLDEMSDAMLNDKALREEIIKELSSISSEDQLTKEDAELLRIASHLQDEEIRTELEEQERIVVERQRRMARRENEHELGVPERADEVEFNDPDEDLWDNPDAHEKQLRHIAEQRLKLLNSIDETHHKAFIEREMARELRFREQLNSEPSAERRTELVARHKAEFERIKAMHGHHPGSQQQLEEVWKETDGLVDEKFDPMVFFHLHDLNGDGYLDEKELEAIFYHEARALHEIDGNLDELAVHEEMRRMRAHVESEADTDKDGMLSQHEFVDMTHRVDFNSDPAWNALVPEFTEEKLREFESRRRAARNRDRGWQENGEHIDEAVIEAARRLEQDVWREQHGKEPLPRGRLGHPVVHPGLPLRNAEPAHPDQPTHDLHAQPEHHPADAAAHPPADHPAAAAEHAQPAHHVDNAAHPAPAGDHPAPAAEHVAAKAEHHAQPAAKQEEHHAQPAAKQEEHHAQPVADGHAQPAAKQEEHHAQPAAKQEEHHAQPAAKQEEHHAQPAAKQEEHHAQPAAKQEEHHAQPAAKQEEHHAQPAAKQEEHHAQPVADGHAQAQPAHVDKSQEHVAAAAQPAAGAASAAAPAAAAQPAAAAVAAAPAQPAADAHAGQPAAH